LGMVNYVFELNHCERFRWDEDERNIPERELCSLAGC